MERLHASHCFQSYGKCKEGMRDDNNKDLSATMLTYGNQKCSAFNVEGSLSTPSVRTHTHPHTCFYFSAMFHLQYPLLQVTYTLTWVFHHRDAATLHPNTHSQKSSKLFPKNVVRQGQTFWLWPQVILPLRQHHADTMPCIYTYIHLYIVHLFVCVCVFSVSYCQHQLSNWGFLRLEIIFIEFFPFSLAFK